MRGSPGCCRSRFRPPTSSPSSASTARIRGQAARDAELSRPEARSTPRGCVLGHGPHSAVLLGRGPKSSFRALTGVSGPLNCVRFDRPSGEGTCYEDSRGRWVFSVSRTESVGPGIKRRVRRNFYGATELQARQAGWKWRHEAGDKLVAFSDRMTVTDLLDAWWPAKEAELRTSTAHRGYSAKVKRLRDLLGGRRIKEVTPDVVTRTLRQARFAPKAKSMTEAKAERSLSSSSIRKHRDLLSAALRWSVGERWLGSNPLADSKSPAVKTRRFTAWTRAEVDTFLTSTKANRMHVLWMAALMIGARKSELLGLQWSDFDGGQVHIHRQLLDDGTRGPLKTDKEDGQEKGARWVSLPSPLVAALEAHKAAAQPGCPWVFATSTGTPFNARNVTEYFRTAIKGAGVPSIRFHDCRHTHASLLLADGADPLAVADRLGHSLQTLMTTYRHVLDRRKDRAADRAEAIFGGPQK